MPLSTEQVLKSITGQSVSAAMLKRAQRDNDRQRFYVGPATDTDDAGPYLVDLHDYVGKMLDNPEKFDRFKKLLRFPVPTSRLIDKASDEYLKAFRAEDRYINFTMSTDNLKQDATAYLEGIGFDDWMQKDLFNQVLRGAASMWIVDLPSTPNVDGWATPQVILREFGKLTDVGYDERGKVTSVIYPLPDLKSADGTLIAKRFGVLDDLAFRVFDKPEQGDPYESINNPHRLRKCPAGMIWHDSLFASKPLRVQSPLHALFADMDRLIIGDVFRQHVDLYASFPMLWRFKVKCKYESVDGYSCKSGYVDEYLRDADGLLMTDKGGDKVLVKKECPACKKNKPAGPGSEFLVPPPVDKESANLSEPAGFINAERDLLDYNVEKLEDLKADILEGLTGDSLNVDQTKDAVNEDQVQARFEARKGILAYWAGHLEQAHYDILWTILTLRYDTQFRTLVVNYGSEFHLLSPAQAVKDYADARTAQLPSYQLSYRRERLDKVLAAGSPETAQRLMILSQLEPYVDAPMGAYVMGSDLAELKANFNYYIKRFERENISLVLFGSALSEAEKFNLITQTLLEYVRNQKTIRSVEEPGGATGSGGTS